MPKFDAREAVEALDYDFSYYDGPVGTTPEPSDHSFQKFAAKQSKLMIEADKLQKDMEKAEKEDRLDEDTLDAFQKKSNEVSEKMSKLIADLCQDKPSKEDVDKLPYRVKTAYISHLMNQFSPEGVTSGTNN